MTVSVVDVALDLIHEHARMLASGELTGVVETDSRSLLVRVGRCPECAGPLLAGDATGRCAACRTKVETSC